MTRRTKTILAAASIVILLGALAAQFGPRMMAVFDPLPLNSVQIERMATTGTFTLYSIDPRESHARARAPDGDGEVRTANSDFLHWFALGKTEIAAAEDRRELLAALRRDLEGGQDQDGAMCWDPRHGIQWTDGRESIDLLVCFFCSRLKVGPGNADLTEYIINPTAESLFDAELTRAGVPLADK
jgi:hypothetical protein